VKNALSVAACRREDLMIGRVLAAIAAIAALLLVDTGAALAQKAGGILRLPHRDNPPSASILEEATISVTIPYMPIYNNLVIFDNTKKHENAEAIVPDLAESWAWDDSKKKLTFKLRQGVKWHDGKPFTSKDVQCTWHMLIGKASNEDFRKNPRAIWYQNLSEVTLNGDHEATFVLKESQPAFPLLLASGYSPIYPCHVQQRDMRTKPIGTGPFKFVEYKRGESIKLVKNQDYWKKGRPYLDGIE
jgi:ABC-type transport system substrate-binding protein